MAHVFVRQHRHAHRDLGGTHLAFSSMGVHKEVGGSQVVWLSRISNKFATDMMMIGCGSFLGFRVQLFAYYCLACDCQGETWCGNFSRLAGPSKEDSTGRIGPYRRQSVYYGSHRDSVLITLISLQKLCCLQAR